MHLQVRRKFLKYTSLQLKNPKLKYKYTKLHNRMLCPEVLNFSAPQCRFEIEKLTNPADFSNTTKKLTSSFIFNHLVSLTIPDILNVPQSLTNSLLDDSDYYRIENIKVSEFIDYKFINTFLNSGEVYALSTNTRIDCDNSFALTPAGHLILNLDKESYQQLGVQGHVSHYHTKTQERYVIDIDLKESHFKPTKANYERIKNSFSNFAQTFNIILLWEPIEANICPSTIAKYFFDLNYVVEKCNVKFDSQTKYSIKTINTNFHDDDKESIGDFIEWLGMIALDVDLDSCGPDKYLNSYDLLEDDEKLGQVKVLQWRGFFSAAKLTKFLQQIQKFKESIASKWISAYVQGFSDTPIQWNRLKHHFYTNGDNSYILIFKSNNNSLLIKQICSQKQYLNKKRKNALY